MSLHGNFCFRLTSCVAWYQADKVSASHIRERLGLPDALVLQQMARALLTPEISPADVSPGEANERSMDPSQQEAAHALRGPLLLEAGPGTGKTRTLVGPDRVSP